ncbi:MAG: DNA polymerase III subunit delta [Eggerthellaceae bacterium]|nr:DNA polymerase III subunit delta [Eggerthellaceae bacterium]
MGNAKDMELLPAYLVVGDDTLKREAVLKRMRVRLEALGDLSFNSDTFSGEDASGEAIVSACNTVPFASEKRLVIVNDAEKLKKADSEPLVEYLSDPTSSTVLLIIAEKLSKNTRLYKAASKVGAKAVIDCARPKKWEMAALVRNMAPSHGIVITEGAAEALLDLLGEDTVRIDTELQKLALSRDGKDAVTEADVRSLVASEAEAKPWDLTDAFAARDLRRASDVLRRMPSASPHALLASCISRIRELICAKCVMAKGGGASQIASELGMPDWKVKNLGAWSKLYTEAELESALEAAVACEREMKSGADADAALKAWMIGVMAA